MQILRQFDRRGAGEIGRDLHGFASMLYPICRSITGSGIRRTLAAIQERIPLETVDVRTGTQVFDWVVPKEWNIRDAYIKGPDGTKVVDFQDSSLHIVNYSVPVHEAMPLNQLKEHLFTLPSQPNLIPYRTSYYRENWGFCLTHNKLSTLPEGEYEVCIDSTLEDGHLTYGECYLAGQTKDEVLISCHCCHPSLANDNLSGISVATGLAQLLMEVDHRYSYRFLFLPGTIGAITWLSRNRDAATRVQNGLVLSCAGDAGKFHYKKSRRGDAEIDRAFAHALRHCGEPFEIFDFSPNGYDERQYCSPGFNLPVGSFMRSIGGTFPEYHTSADDLDFIRPPALAGSLRVCAAVVDVLEENRRYCNLNPYCEPQLGKRGLYASMGGGALGDEISARLWVLNLSDGEHSLLEIAERSGLPFTAIRTAAEALHKAGLLSTRTAQ